MGLEIERKFLLDAGPGALPSMVVPTRAWAILQGYVTPPGADPEVRIRLARPVDPSAAPEGPHLEDDGPGDPATDADRAGDRIIRRLTTKASVDAPTGGAVRRIEVEVDLDPDAFDELWQVTAGRRLRKVRVEHALDGDEGLVLTIDHFGGRLRGLVLGEIEFQDEAASRTFDPPAFLHTDVSEDGRYRNAELAAATGPPAPPDGPTA